MLDGRNALERGDFDLARQIFEAATREDPDNIYEIYDIVIEVSEEEGSPGAAADILLAPFLFHLHFQNNAKNHRRFQEEINRA